MSDGIAGKFIMGDGLPQGDTTRITVYDLRFASTTNDPGPELVSSLETPDKGYQAAVAMYSNMGKNSLFTSEADLRAFVREEVHKTLDDLAREMQQNKAFLPVHTPSGICWACGEHGQDMMWYEREGRSHLIHSTVECVRAAEIKPEQREHKG